MNMVIVEMHVNQVGKQAEFGRDGSSDMIVEQKEKAQTDLQKARLC